MKERLPFVYYTNTDTASPAVCGTGAVGTYTRHRTHQRSPRVKCSRLVVEREPCEAIRSAKSFFKVAIQCKCNFPWRVIIGRIDNSLKVSSTQVYR